MSKVNAAKNPRVPRTETRDESKACPRCGANPPRLACRTHAPEANEPANKGDSDYTVEGSFPTELNCKCKF